MDVISYLLGKNNSGGKSILPNGYMQIKYIEGTGTQYINTGRKTTTKSKLDFTYLSNKAAGVAYQSLFGSLQYSNKWRAYMLIGTNNNIQLSFPYQDNDINYYMTKDGTLTTTLDVSSPNTVIINKGEKNHYVYDLLNRTITINQYTAVAPDTETMLPSYDNMLIFQRNTANGVSPTNMAVGKMYEFKWYEEDELVMHLIPCIKFSNLKIGMYDIIGNQFYSSASNDEFIYTGVEES